MRVELLNKPTRGKVAANRERGRCPDGKEPAGYSTKCDNKTSLIAAFQLKNMENSWGTRTRTRKGRTRICSVANYTIPQTCRRNRDALSITPANLQTSPILTKISQRFFKKKLLHFWACLGDLFATLRDFLFPLGDSYLVLTKRCQNQRGTSSEALPS